MDSQIKSFELTEAEGLTKLRESAIQWISLRCFKDTKPSENAKLAELLNTRFLLRLGFLLTGTKTSKVTKETEVDVVLKAFELSETTEHGKPVKIISLNQRIGLDKMRKPLNHAERVERCFGATVTALLTSIFPPEPNKKGNLTKTREFNEAAVLTGFPYWNAPLDHAKTASARIAPKVSFAVDAFEIPKPAKKDEARTEYRALILTKDGKELKSLKCSKADYEAFHTKASELTIAFKSVDPDAERKANKLHKALNKAAEAKADEAAKDAELAEAIKDANSLN